MLQVALAQVRQHARRFIAVGLAVVMAVGFLTATLMVNASTEASLGNSIGAGFRNADLVVGGGPDQPLNAAAVEAVSGPEGNYELHHVLRIAPDFAPNWSAEIAGELAEGMRIPTGTAIKKFSRGQLSAVAIVLGLASRAPLTLLDEPYLGLDVTARAFFHSMLLRDYQEHPRTIVLSTHLIEESESLLDRVVILDQGRVVVNDETDSAREQAFVLSGTSDAVTRVVGDYRVLETQTLGGLRTLTAVGSIDASLRDLATAHGVQLAPATLQQLVSAYGAGDAELPTAKVSV